MRATRARSTDERVVENSTPLPLFAVLCINYFTLWHLPREQLELFAREAIHVVDAVLFSSLALHSDTTPEVWDFFVRVDRHALTAWRSIPEQWRAALLVPAFAREQVTIPFDDESFMSARELLPRHYSHP